ncbi:MAG TPA: NAD(P)/FAD-dependent oxidoreductase [Candidatus Acidoferrales bacterium]|jgi:monoamine oxidase|nr:NAD(P)/FAD-dependent oxidoreductase [Candidatus Acidoferrales bacterium]
MMDVVVIGAGAAGLQAARALAARSLRVVVIEARDRIGGRVYPVATNRRIVPAELGAEFIHGTAPETLALLRETGGAAVDVEGESWTNAGDGLVLDEGNFIASASIFEGIRALKTDESVERFLQRFDGDAAMRATVASARAFVEGFEAADPAIASTRAIADEVGSGVDSKSARPIGGYGPIFDYLHGAVAGACDLRLSTIVRRISWRRGEVRVETETPHGESQTVVARAAVITLPIGVLRHTGDDAAVAFEPPLPAAKRESIEKLEMGHVVKVALWFRSAFWETLRDGRYRDGAFFHDDGPPFAAYWTQLPVRGEVVSAWAGGPNATALSDVAAPELIDRALDGLGRIFGAPALVREAFESGAMHDWTRDPFARGAYSYVAVGGGNARGVLGMPLENTLFFAGEATSTDGQGGTVNGAFETGTRAAREAAAALGIGAVNV